LAGGNLPTKMWNYPRGFDDDGKTEGAKNMFYAAKDRAAMSLCEGPSRHRPNSSPPIGEG